MLLSRTFNIDMTDHRLKMLYGIAILLILAVLSAIIALAHVEEATSYGLDKVLTGLLMLAAAFAQWAFSGPKGTEHDQGTGRGAICL